MDSFEQHEVPELGLDLSNLIQIPEDDFLNDENICSGMDEVGQKVDQMEESEQDNQEDNDEDEDESMSEEEDEESDETEDEESDDHMSVDVNLNVSTSQIPNDSVPRPAPVAVPMPVARPLPVTRQALPAPRIASDEPDWDAVMFRNLAHAVSNVPHVTRRNLDQSRIDNGDSSINSSFDTNLMNEIENTNVESFQNIVSAADTVRASYNIRDKDLFPEHRAKILEALKVIHESLSTRPLVSEVEATPARLNGSLMPHQAHALKYMMWRETLKPAGGILADDMGLGKTLSIISLILAKLKEKNKMVMPRQCRVEGGTLIVCPASIVHQWQKELEKWTSDIRLMVYHQTKVKNCYIFGNFQAVITTYGYVTNDFKCQGPLYQTYWTRVVLDEAHIIRNSKTQASEVIETIKLLICILIPNL